MTKFASDIAIHHRQPQPQLHSLQLFLCKGIEIKCKQNFINGTKTKKTLQNRKKYENRMQNCFAPPGFTRAITRCAATAAGAFCGLRSAEKREGREREREGLITQSDKAGRKETEDGWRKGGGEGGDDAWIGYSTLARARRATRAGRAGITLFRRIERVSEPSSSSCSCEQPFDGWTNAMRTRINEASKRRFLRSLLPVCARKRQRAICDRYCPH